MNRAMSGDLVVVEVFPPSEWRAPGDEVINQEGMYCSSFTLLLHHFNFLPTSDIPIVNYG
jgi:hypothetical protein